jgi:hypothetical protein
MSKLKLQLMFLLCSLFILTHSAFAIETIAHNGGWTQITPDPGKFMGRYLEPSCSSLPGTPSDFSFFVRKGKRPFVVLYLDGGGACFNTQSCVAVESITYQPFINEKINDDGQIEATDRDGNVQIAGGIFDIDQADNTFKDWTQVYVPYCTGDIWWGSGEGVYPINESGDSVTIQHRGLDNMLSVLKLVKKILPDTKRILLAGGSAGSYGILALTPFVEKAFPRARISVLSDAGVGVFDPQVIPLAAAMWQIDPELLDFVPGLSDYYEEENNVSYPFYEYEIPELISILADSYRDINFGQYTTSYDGLQAFFYYMCKHPNDYAQWFFNDEIITSAIGEWHIKMLDNLYENESINNYRFFIGPGNRHMILQFDDYYTDEVEGVAFSDWLKAMVWRPNINEGEIWKNLEFKN